MATEKTNNEEKAMANTLPNEVKEALEGEKKSFFGKMGKGLKIGLGVAATLLTGGAVWLVVHLLGGKDDDEEEAAEAESPSDE